MTTLKRYSDDNIINAKLFLKRIGVKFKVKFIEHGEYFTNDKETRDIYEVTMTKGTREYRFKFGQSINCSGKYMRYYGSSIQRVMTLKYVSYYERKEFKPNPNFSEPKEYDVLACITKYDPGTFEEFCSQFGLDFWEDEQAEGIYESVKDEFMNVCTLFTDEEIEYMNEHIN